MIVERDLLAPRGFACAGVRPEGSDSWYVLVSQEDDLWLCVATTTLTPKGVVFHDGDLDFAAKLVALLGMAWGLLEQDFEKFVEWQRRCQGHLRQHVNDSIELATLGEVREWRQRVESRTGGELLRAAMTGDAPWAVAN